MRGHVFTISAGAKSLICFISKPKLDLATCFLELIHLKDETALTD
jgi:hypothetical protein